MLDLLDAPRFLDVNEARKAKVPRQNPNWTDKELEILERMYPRASVEDLLLALPGRSWRGIKVKATKHGVRRDLDVIPVNYGERWTTGEIGVLQAIYPNAPKHVVLAVFNTRNWQSIQSCAHRYGIVRQYGMTRLSDEDKAIMLQVNELGKQEVLRQLPHLTWNVIRKKIFDMGVEINVLPKKDLDLLWEMYSKGYEPKDIQTMLSIPPQTYGRALNYLKGWK